MRIHSSEPFDNLDALPVLVAVADAGSITGAARQLDLSQATVSGAIKRLEADLGVRLFERTTRALRITAEGAVMIEHARAALAIVSQAQTEVRNGARHISGRIAITASAMMVREVLAGWTAAFVSRHPAVEIELHAADQQADLIRDGFDLALRNGPLADSRFVARLLAPARRWACASPSYLKRRGSPKHPAELADHDCLVSRKQGRMYDVWQFSEAGSAEPPVQVRVGSRLCSHDASTAFLWAVAGHGITYQSEVTVTPALERGQLVRVLPGYVGDEVPLFALLPNNRLLPGRVSVLLDELSALFAR
jgi:DNA-binding transcriptional LysR family regulator